jgi:hypothetical protein
MFAARKFIVGKDKRCLRLLVWVVFPSQKFTFNDLAGNIEAVCPVEVSPVI